MEILIGLGIAVMLSLSTFATKWQKGEEFQWYKLSRTVVVGIVLGGVAYWQGIELTAENWSVYVGANAGAIHYADQGLKFVYRLIVKSDA